MHNRVSLEEIREPLGLTGPRGSRRLTAAPRGSPRGGTHGGAAAGGDYFVKSIRLVSAFPALLNV